MRLRRLLLATAVLSGTVYWANCSFNVGVLPVAWNSFFDGCFEGAAGGSKAIVVFTVPADPADHETFTGCIGLNGKKFLAAIAGDVDDTTFEQAALSVVPAAPQAAFALTAVRTPAGAMAADSIRLSDAGGAPPDLAATGDLNRCAVPITCQDLGFPVAFAPEAP